MKYRYFILPIIILSLIIYIINNDKNIINKEIMISNYNVNYPFFNNEKIDNYIFSYLSDLYISDNGNITYKLYEKDGMYYLTFYRQINNKNMIINDRDSFVINIKNSKIDKCYMVG